MKSRACTRGPHQWKTRLVGFFADTEPPADTYREPEPRRVRWRGDVDDTAGVSVPLSSILVCNEEVAVVVSGLLAYPSGFVFSLTSISRLEPAPRPLGFHHPGARGRGELTGGELRFGIGFADGSKVVSYRSPSIPTDKSTARSLRPRGGGGGGRRWSQEFWCEPLPPDGPMTFVMEWRDFGVSETSMDVDGGLISEAGSGAVPLWPDDVDLPEESGSRPRGWPSSSYSSAMRSMSSS